MGVVGTKRTRAGECAGNVWAHRHYRAAFGESARHKYKYTERTDARGRVELADADTCAVFFLWASANLSQEYDTLS